MAKFLLYQHVFIVKGAKYQGLYDFKSGNIFAIGRIEASIIEYLNQVGSDLLDFPEKQLSKVQDFLNQLTEHKLGEIVEDNASIHEQHKFDQKPQTLKQLWITTNYSCNLHCNHCYLNLHNEDYRKTISTTRVLEAVEDARKHMSLDFVQVIGGEPLLFAKNALVTLLKGIHDIGIPVIEIFTNGTLIDDFYINIFKKLNINIALSIYGKSPETHDSITGVSGSWQKTINSIKLLKDNNINFRFGVVAVKQNMHAVREVNPWLNGEFDVNGDEYSFDVVRICRNVDIKEIVPWDLFKEKHIRSYPNFEKVTEELVENRMYYNSCWGNIACILPNGDVTPCIMEKDNIQGNIYHTTLTEIILGPSGDSAQRLSIDKIDICQDCEYRYACWECRAMANCFDKESKKKPATCLYDPYKGEWNPMPKNLADLFSERTGGDEDEIC